MERRGRKRGKVGGEGETPNRLRLPILLILKETDSLKKLKT